MRPITKNDEPRALVEYRNANQGRLAAMDVFEDFPGKDELRQALCAEQGALCCYCMKRIEPNAQRMKVEHWHPRRGGFLAEQLDYANLLGACKGGEGFPPYAQHCDTSKGSRTLFANPADPNRAPLLRSIRYMADGRMHSDHPEVQRDIEDQDRLNLNLRSLCREREQAMRAIAERCNQLRGKPDRRGQLQRLLAAWDSRNGAYREFCQAILHVLRKELRR